MCLTFGMVGAASTDRACKSKITWCNREKIILQNFKLVVFRYCFLQCRIFTISSQVRIQDWVLSVFCCCFFWSCSQAEQIQKISTTDQRVCLLTDKLIETCLRSNRENLFRRPLYSYVYFLWVLCEKGVKWRKLLYLNVQ